MAGLVQTVFRQPKMADGDWGPFSSSAMNRGEVCLQANTEDVMSLPHCRTISGSRYWSPVSTFAEQSKGSIKTRASHVLSAGQREALVQAVETFVAIKAGGCEWVCVSAHKCSVAIGCFVFPYPLLVLRFINETYLQDIFPPARLTLHSVWQNKQRLTNQPCCCQMPTLPISLESFQNHTQNLSSSL